MYLNTLGKSVTCSYTGGACDPTSGDEFSKSSILADSFLSFRLINAITFSFSYNSLKWCSQRLNKQMPYCITPLHSLKFVVSAVFFTESSGDLYSLSLPYNPDL